MADDKKKAGRPKKDPVKKEDKKKVSAKKDKEKETAPIAKSAKVFYSAGVTLNMGDFESTRVDIGVTRNCPSNEEDIGNMLDDIKVFVDTRLKGEIKNLRGGPDTTDVAPEGDKAEASGEELLDAEVKGEEEEESDIPPWDDEADNEDDEVTKDKTDDSGDADDDDLWGDDE